MWVKEKVHEVDLEIALDARWASGSREAPL
jgi:hypothetical protein